MLNISKNTIKETLPFNGAKSLVITLPLKESRKRLKILAWMILVFFLMLENLGNQGRVF